LKTAMPVIGGIRILQKVVANAHNFEVGAANKRFTSAFSTDKLVGSLVCVAHFAKCWLMSLREQ